MQKEWIYNTYFAYDPFTTSVDFQIVEKAGPQLGPDIFIEREEVEIRNDRSILSYDPGHYKRWFGQPVWSKKGPDIVEAKLWKGGTNCSICEVPQFN